MKRILYFVYYLKQLDREKFRKFSAHVKAVTGKSVMRQWWEIFRNAMRWNISILEYYQFGFWKPGITNEEKASWAGTGYMYEYQRIMNPPGARKVLDDKRAFARQYREFMVHRVVDLETIHSSPEQVNGLLHTTSGKMVLKPRDGKCGAQVLIRQTAEFDVQSLEKFLHSSEYDLAEEFIIQHADLNRLSPSAVNTVRVVTQLNEKNEVDILACRLRISVNSHVDNLAAGNLAAPVDPSSGVVNGKAVYSDITKEPVSEHPVTGTPITGFQIPFWKETIELVSRAAISFPENRSIGWDVVITENGPGLIEGNHDWCKLLWQLPAGKGLKKQLEKYVPQGV